MKVIYRESFHVGSVIGGYVVNCRGYLIEGL